MVFPSTFNIHPQMRVCGLFRESFGPQKSLGFLSILTILRNMNQRRWTLRPGRMDSGVWVMGLVYPLMGCHLPPLPPSELSVCQAQLWFLAPWAAFACGIRFPCLFFPSLSLTSWVPVTIHLPCGIRSPCVWWITHQLDYNHSFSSCLSPYSWAPGSFAFVSR